MQQEFGPVDQTLVDLGERGGVVLRKLNPFPELGGEVGALDRLHVEVESAVVAADCGIAGVCEWAGLAVAKASDLEELVSIYIFERNLGGKRQTLYSFLQKFWPLVVLLRR